MGLIREKRLVEMFHGSFALNQADIMLRLAFGIFDVAPFLNEIVLL
jgi:hypothetical protein